MTADVRHSLRSMREDLRQQPPPSEQASVADHAWYLLGQFVAWALSPWYWLVVVVVTAVAAFVELVVL